MKKLLGRFLIFVFGQKRMTWLCRDFLPLDHPMIKLILEMFYVVEYKDFRHLKQCAIKDDSGELVGLFKNNIGGTDLVIWMRLYCATKGTDIPEEDHKYFLAVSYGDGSVRDGLYSGIYRSAETFKMQGIATALVEMIPTIEATKNIKRIMSFKASPTEAVYVSPKNEED